jgi:hypothetical protein
MDNVIHQNEFEMTRRVHPEPAVLIFDLAVARDTSAVSHC